MFQLELHVFCTSDSQKLLGVVENRIKEVLSYYSNYFDGSILDDIEIGGGVTEVSGVQNNPESLPD
jgi:hypothetical protein